MIFVIRHAETASNAARVIQRPEAPLSPRGLDQAERLARRLAAAGITDVLASDYPRAVMTAERLAAATGARLRLDALLRERNYGDIRGMAYDAVKTDIFAADFVPPGGESWCEFHARVALAWDVVRETAAGTAGHLAVVTHGLVCGALALRHFALQPGTEPLMWRNASVTTVEAKPPWRVLVCNDTSHLQDGAAKGEV